MTEPVSGGTRPTPPEDFRVGFAQILRLQERVRQTLLRIRKDLDSPAVRTIAHTLEDERGSRVTPPLARMGKVLDELIATTDLAATEVTAELDRLSEASGAMEKGGLPSGLARFVAERSAAPGFAYETRKDALRGWVVDWVERIEDGSVRAGGLLYEKPHAWFRE